MVTAVLRRLPALILSLVFVPIARYLPRGSAMAKPREDRWNKRPVALFGGVAIAASLFVSVGVFRLGRELVVLASTAALMSTVGFVDDVLNLKPATKLIAQIALASTLLFFDYRLNWVQSVTLDSILTMCWVVGLTNAFNLLDNMDGLCGGITVIAGASLLIGLLPGASPHAFAEARYLAILLGASAVSSCTTSTPRRSSWAMPGACLSASASPPSR
jgi:UDP-GlcNAc:undecaprenyl-phosphate GlcNAc-1-phosphate transferase